MRRQPLALGFVATSNEENEFRLPLHPAHLPQLEPALRSRIFVEEGYGSKFGVDRAYMAEHVAGIMSREELFEHCDVVVLFGADLSGADLIRAKLEGADLRGAVLVGADLSTANLKWASAAQAQLEQALSLKGATMPDGTVHE
jgi:hypothetical protein